MRIMTWCALGCVANALFDFSELPRKWLSKYVKYIPLAALFSHPCSTLIVGDQFNHSNLVYSEQQMPECIFSNVQSCAADNVTTTVVVAVAEMWLRTSERERERLHDTRVVERTGRYRVCEEWSEENRKAHRSANDCSNFEQERRQSMDA